MRYVIALDIGGTNLRAAIVNSDYEIIRVIVRSTARGSLISFYDDVLTIIGDLDFKELNPIAIAIGVPGRVRANGFIDELPNIAIENIDLITVIKNRFHLPVFIRNDAEMASIAEGIVGSGMGLKSSYFITISTGIGGALFENGMIKNPSKEIGHMLVKYQDNYYELEKIASGVGVLKLLELNDLPLPSAKEFFDRVRENDLLYLNVYQDWLRLIANFIKFIDKAFAPDVVVLTGGVMKSSDVFFDSLKKLVTPINLVPTHFSQDSGLIGAAAYGFIMNS